MTDADVYLLLASAFSRKSAPKEAEKTPAGCIETNPKSTTLRFALADLYVRARQVEPAIQQYEKAMIWSRQCRRLLILD